MDGRIPEASARFSVLVPFVIHGQCRRPSFPRRACPEPAEGRESTPQTFENALSTEWIPAVAGMTGVPNRIPFQMTSTPGSPLLCVPSRAA
jgi:hypothetical protein